MRARERPASHFAKQVRAEPAPSFLRVGSACAGDRTCPMHTARVSAAPLGAEQASGATPSHTDGKEIPYVWEWIGAGSEPKLRSRCRSRYSNTPRNWFTDVPYQVCIYQAGLLVTNKCLDGG